MVAPWTKVARAIAALPDRSRLSIVRFRDDSSAAGLPANRAQYSSTVHETNFPSRMPSMCAVGRKAFRISKGLSVAWPRRY